MTAVEGVENDCVVRLIQAYREKGDRRAVERIFSIHGKILNHIVRRYSGSLGETYEDLLQVGYVGLIEAVNGYKTGSSARFSSYVCAVINGEIRHHFRDAGLVKRPRWARSLYSQIAEATKLTGQLGRPPTVDEIAREVNVTPEGVLEVMRLFLNTNVSSLDAYGPGCDGDETNLGAIKSLQHDTFSLPIEDRIPIQQGLDPLSELQRKVVYLFLHKDLSQTEIGKRLGFPQRKVSRIIASSMKSLRERIVR